MIHFEDVSFSYGGTPLLQRISFEVSPGTYIGIIGPNGGGKTTLLKLIMGFVAPTTGFVKILGTTPKKAQKQIGYVPQGFHYDRSFPISVMEIALSGCLSSSNWYGGYSNKDIKKAEEALDKVGLLKMGSLPFSELSGGLAQRALIARALAAEPKLLLLDEPTSGVDIQAELEIYELLDRFKGDMTILIVTHDLSCAIDRVDRVFCVQGGVVAISPDQVCEHFALGLYHTPLKIAKIEDRK